MNVTKRDAYARSPGTVMHCGRVVTTTGGTIGSTDCEGFTVVKTATKTGRYTVQLADVRGQAITALKLRNCVVTLIGPDDAALTTTKGLVAVIRDDDMATDGTFEIQFVQTNAGNADTEVQDSASFDITFWVKDSQVK